MLKHVDLCSGIGGFALGFGWAELSHPVLFCDIEPWSRKILAKHWPDVKIAEDVKELANDPDGLVPDCDILTAGYPCQPFSVAGKQRGEEDDRHIWPEIFRIIKAKRPNWIVCENVYGHISMGLDTVLSDLETEGYSCQPFIVPACAVNAPHRRDRLWIVGYTEHDGSSATEITGKHGQDEERRSERKSKAEQSARTGQPKNNENVGDTENNRCDRGATPVRREGAQNKQVEQFSVRGKLSRPSENVAHANSDRTERDKSENREGSGVVKNSADVAYTDNKRSQGRLSGGKDAERQSEHGHTRCSSAVHRQPTEEWWAAEPNVGRVANGIPKRVDRLKGLGNAIVPQIAMQIGLCIKQVNEQNES
jgi:DNA (cytosine-5)-methyltransferase 1|tara:strand:+ start:1093 stop:2187 length:1095 start_codon:yes stop_codon:yes gene_type:complete